MKRQVQMRITRGRGGSGLRAEAAASIQNQLFSSIQNQLFSSIQNQYFLLFSSSTMLRHLTVGPSLLTSCGASIGLVMRWQQSWREECVCNDEPLHSPRAAQQRGSKPVRVLGAGRQRQCVSHRSLLAEREEYHQKFWVRLTWLEPHWVHCHRLE